MAKSLNAILASRKTQSEMDSISVAKFAGSFKSYQDFKRAAAIVSALSETCEQTGEYKGMRVSGASDHTAEANWIAAAATGKATGFTIGK